MPESAAAIGIAGLLAAAAAAARIRPEDTLVIGGSELAGSDYLRLFALVGSLVALALTVLGLASTSHRNAPGVLLAGMGSAVLALALTDARIGVLAATAGGLFGILVTIASPATPRSVVVASRELRALAIAGVLAILATAWIGRPLGGLAVVPEVFGFAYLGFAAAVAIRFGAIPFHFWAARLADAAPEVTLPMLMAWGPAAFAIVALTWADQSVAPLLLPLTAERIAIVAVGAASAVLGMVAAGIQDDLEHVVGYTIIADAGIAILGVAALSPEAWSPAREWILVFITVRSAFAAWAVAMRGAFRTRRISELGGWAVRAPLLAVALVLIAVGGGRVPRARRVAGAGEPRRPDDRRADRDHRGRLVGRPARDLRPAADRGVVEALAGGRRGPQRAPHLAGHRGGTPRRRTEPRRAGVRAGRARDRRVARRAVGHPGGDPGEPGAARRGDRGPRRGARAVAVGRRARGRRGVAGRAGAGWPGPGRGSRRAVVGGTGVVVAGRIAGLGVGAAGPASADRIAA